MRHRSVVPLNSARDAHDEPRVRLHRVPLALQDELLCMGICDGDTISQVKARIESHMKLLNDGQRRALLLKLGVVLGES